MATHDDAERRARFRALHERGCFVLPNPWDVGGLRRLEARGFNAVATTSAGLAWSLGVEDYEITLDDALRHLEQMCSATALPVNADFENGFADDAAGVARNVTRAIGTGIAGLSIEDRARGADLYERSVAVERLRAARAAIDADGGDVMLVARCELFLTGGADVDEVLARVAAFADAGADCIYAPGVADPAAVQRIVETVAPLPVNVLYWPPMSFDAMAAVGVRRISLGGALARAAWQGFDKFLDRLPTVS